MSAWNASRCRSKCSFTCSSKDSGTPAGTTKLAGIQLARSFLGDFEPPLDLANASVSYSSRRARSLAPRSFLKRARLCVDRIENAALLLSSGGAHLRIGTAASRTAARKPPAGPAPSEAARRRRPGNRVRVSAAIALAAVARIRARIFKGELERRQQRFLADLLRDDLVDGGAVVNIGAGRLFGLVGAQVRRGNPVIGAGLAGRRLSRLRPQPAHDHRLVQWQDQ